MVVACNVLGNLGRAMDLNKITAVERPKHRNALPLPLAGDSWLAGGTWLFSEPQPNLQRLIDLAGLAWEPLEITSGGLSIAATCTIANLEEFESPPSWLAGPLIGQCCRSFLASFKIWNMATVGGNLCCALPAGPMISLCASLDGSCLLWTPNGSERRMPVVEFVRGPQQTALHLGDVLRRIDLPHEALTRRTAFRRISLTPLGRSGALLIGTMSGDKVFSLTVTASTRRPVQLAFGTLPAAAMLRERLETEIPANLYYDDIHGRPDWRRHMTLAFAEEIRAELAERA